YTISHMLYSLSLPDALPILWDRIPILSYTGTTGSESYPTSTADSRTVSIVDSLCSLAELGAAIIQTRAARAYLPDALLLHFSIQDRKSTRLNSSHQIISYSV